MKFIFAAIYAVAAVAVSGQQYTGPVFITSPLTGTVYNAGKPAVINWINPVSDVITKIVLAQGISTNIQPLITIAENVDSKLGTYSWDVPTDILPGDNYAFVLGVSPNVSYTGQFTIKNGNAPVSSGAASSSAAASGAAASGAAASGAASSGAAVTPAAPSVAAPSAAASSAPSKAAPSGASQSAHGSSSATPAASSSTSAGSSNKVAFGAVAVAGAAVMALI
ncbi:uncharacterized protein EV154DRAFT_460895 [Mucor mucedo]|uniref:uncharacterized protein n=1 Tax=Mucor mucedo TaxID=29922 RepID=UPI00221FB9C8|nr:uncharacterized protein EV154DRAFT_460895 [Mucor mucedo]KAI7893517.1 hypothetical protein EV154DRAFT_460895 [Mucor mucedo]